MNGYDERRRTNYWCVVCFYEGTLDYLLALVFKEKYSTYS